MKGLIIRQPHIDRILDGLKTWEMRSTPTKVRGRIALIQAGSGMIVGECDLVNSIEPYLVTYIDIMREYKNHRIDAGDSHLLAKWKYAWVIENAVRYDKPIPYDHPQGAVIWVNLDKP